MKPYLLFVVIATAAALTAQEAQNSGIVGDWAATLIASGNEIHLSLHVRQAAGIKLTATMDSAEQGTHGVPVSGISFNNSTLNFTIDSAHATYNGTLNPATGAVDGVWSQGVPTPLTFIRVIKSPLPPAPSPLDGAWQGVLQVGGYPLHLVFHITTTRTGLAATMDSPDQNKLAIPVIDARIQGNNLVLQLPNIGAKYQGSVAADLSVIDGVFTQGGAAVPLSLTRGKKN